MTLTATADSGYRVKAWSGTDDDGSTALTNTVTMDADKTVTVEFELIPSVQYDLTVNTAGSGSVTLDPAGGTYDEGTPVELTAVPSSGWQFAGWTGDVDDPDAAVTTIVMDADKAVTANFTAMTSSQIVSDDFNDCALGHRIMDAGGSAGRCDS